MPRQTEDDPQLRAALRRLPPCEPPPAVFAKIETRLSAPRRSFARPVLLALAAGIAGAVAVTMFFSFGSERDRAGAVDGTAQMAATTARSASLGALVAESARLERTLVSLPRFDGVVRVGTASTIAGLEDHIAWIDAELSAGEALDADPVYREALWRERVDIMNALIDVQYAQLPATVLLQ